MDSELLNSIKMLLDMGFPAVMLIINYMLWREFKFRVNAHIDDLRRIAYSGCYTPHVKPIVNSDLIEEVGV